MNEAGNEVEEVDDVVLWDGTEDHTEPPNKLLAEWRGPYPVVRKISNVNYEVRMFDCRKKKRIFHINMLALP